MDIIINRPAPCPSAILEPIDMTALRICEDKAYSSFLGSCKTARYTKSLSFLATCHASSSL